MADTLEERVAQNIYDSMELEMKRLLDEREVFYTCTEEPGLNCAADECPWFIDLGRDEERGGCFILGSVLQRGYLFEWVDGSP